MINLLELRNKLFNTVGDSYDVYSKNPLISMISSLINDITGYKDGPKELKDIEVDYLPLRYYSVRCLYFSDSEITMPIFESILSDLEIGNIGIVFDGNYYIKRGSILKKLLKSFVDLNWYPIDFDKKNNVLILKKK